MSPLILGLDLGTGSVKGVILASNGSLVAQAREALETAYPRPGYAEQSSDAWHVAMARVVQGLLHQVPTAVDRIAGIGVCGAAHVPVLLDETQRPVRPAILWTDQRSTREVEQLRASHGDDLLRVAFNAPSPTWTLPQLMWLQRNEPAVHRRIRHLLIGKDAVVHRFTGRLVTDAGSAASSLLMDVGRGAWSPSLVELTGLDPDSLPEILGSHEIVGGLCDAVAEEVGLRAGTPVIAGGLDSVFELVALGIIRPGQAMLRLGTAGGVMSVSERPSPHPQLITYPFLDRGWASQAFTSSCASSLAWLQDLFSSETTTNGRPHGRVGFEVLDDLAAAVPPGSDGLRFHPYLAGERAPHWDPHLRGSFTGISLHHDRGYLVRAVMEGIACSMRDCLDATRDTGRVVDELRATGGVTRSTVATQIVSDVLELPVHRMQAEGSVLGVAMLAGCAVDVFDDLDDAVSRCVREQDVLQPDPGRRDDCRRLVASYRDIIDALRPLYRARAE